MESQALFRLTGGKPETGWKDYNSAMRKTMLLFVLFISFLFPAAAESSCTDLPAPQEEQIESQLLGKPLHFSVYLPPCYDERLQKRYPVIYLFHGQNMDENVWEQLDLRETLKAGWQNWTLPSFLVVAVREEDFLQDLYFSNFGDAVLDELIPWIDSNYHTCAESSCRAVMGISRGALWAADILLSSPNPAAAGALISLPGSPFDPQTLYALTESYLSEEPGTLPFRLLIDSGSEDAYRVKAQELIDQLTLAGLPFTNQLHAGAHDEAFWRSRLPETLAWLSVDW